MRKIRLSESELTNIVRRVINEQETPNKEEFVSHIESVLGRMSLPKDLSAMDICDTVMHVCKIYKDSNGTRFDQSIFKGGKKVM